MSEHPTVNDAKKLAKASGLRRCVILFETDLGQVGYASYGDTVQLCKSTREIMDGVFEHVEHSIHFDSTRLGIKPKHHQ